MYPAVLDDIMNEVWEAYESIGNNLLMKPFDQSVNNWIDGEIDKLKETIKNKYNANIDIKSSTSFNNIDGKYSIRINQICVQLSGDPNVYMQKEDGWECLRVANPQELPL